MNNLKTKKPGVSILFEILICIFYMWYFLPVVNATLSAGFFKYIFFGCYFGGVVGLFLLNGFKLNKITGAVLLYFLVLTTLYLLNVGDAHRHIRVSFTFWGTALLYFGVLNDDGRIRIGKFLLVLYIITCITSAIGVIMDNGAARTITHAAADDNIQKSFRQKNIGSIYIFQSMVFWVPILICLPKMFWTKLVSTILLAMIFFVLSNASFFISIIVFIFAIAFSLVVKQKNITRMIWVLIISVALIILYIMGYDLLTMICNNVDNHRFVERILGIRDLLYGGQNTGDVGLRLELYLSSLQTFLKHPFGVGSHYSYITFDNDIGYHSQLLDDMARYGIFALGFYTLFFMGYYKNLKENYNKLQNGIIAILIVVIYICFLILNLGFRSAEEGIMTLYIIPVLPLLLKNKSEDS